MALIRIGGGAKGEINATASELLTTSSITAVVGQCYLFQIDLSVEPNLTGCEVLTSMKTGIIGSSGTRRIYTLLVKATATTIGGLSANDTNMSVVTVQ